MLASVTGPAEALLAAKLGADILDAKDPSSGALGRLPLTAIGRIRSAVPGLPLSATIGDLPAEPDVIAASVQAVAAEGVDFIKVGFFPGGNAAAAIARLGTMKLHPKRIVGVLLADRAVDFDLIDRMASARFAGVMLDTADKTAGPLTAVASAGQLAVFIARARAAGLFAGLAGALRVNDIPGLLALEPDILGFRGALCAGSDRVGAIEPRAFTAVRAAIPGGTRTSLARARAGSQSEKAGRA